MTARPKSNPMRSESYRRLVAALPCKQCGIHGYSQAAHLPPDGKAIKADDRMTFPLCCTRPGILGCHASYDRYILFPRAEAMKIGRQWAQETRSELGMFA